MVRMVDIDPQVNGLNVGVQVEQGPRIPCMLILLDKLSEAAPKT